MSDPALPECVEFSQMEYIAFSFKEAKHPDYDLFFFVDTSKGEPPRVVLISPAKQKIELLFGPTATIGINGFKLCYNPNDLVKVNLESSLCSSSKDGKHQWQETFSSTNLVVLACSNCGHIRFLATPELIKQWEENGTISSSLQNVN